MTRLSESDLGRALEVIRRVAATSSRDEFCRTVLAGTLELIPSLAASVTDVDPSRDRVFYWVEPADFVGPPDGERRLAELAGEHPLIRNHAVTGDGSARRLSDFWTDAQFRSSPLFHDVYAPMGVHYQMSICLPAPRPVVLGVVVNRADRDFSDHDRDLLDLLRPHFAQGWLNARDRERLAAMLGAATTVLEEAHRGAVVLHDRPEELTPGALVTLYRHFGRPSARSALPARVERWLEAAQRAPALGRGELAGLRPLVSQLADRRAVLNYLPGTSRQPPVLLIEERDDHPVRDDFVRLGLTDREAEITRLVVSGLTNSAIAAELHISTGTVKKHLDNIYVKIGVHRRAALAALAPQMLRR